MKIVCDACGAKYSISDDKVQGKVFKIRCKKCQNIIVVRGNSQAAEAAAPQPAFEKDTRVYDYDNGQAPGGDEPVWHVVIDQEQVGPLTVAEVQERFNAGQLDVESYIWRDGYADWVPLRDVQEFAALASGGQAVGGGQAAVANMFSATVMGPETAGVAAVRNDARDVFNSSASPSLEQYQQQQAAQYAAPAAQYAAPAADPYSGSVGASPSGQMGAMSSAEVEAQKMRGQRNENSVLFSLNNLAQLASGPAKPAAAPAAIKATGQAHGEGSGLIDIRSMASAYMGDRGKAGGKPGSAGVGSIDDIPVFSTAAFSEPAVLMPTPGARPAGNSKLMYGLIAAIGALAVVLVILLVTMMGGDKKPTTTAATDKAAAQGKSSEDKAKDETAKPTDGNADKPAEKTADNTTNDKPGETTPPPTDKPADKVADKPADKPADKVADKPADKTDRRDTKKTTTTASKPADKPAKTEPVATTTKPDSGGGGCDQVDCIINNYEKACCAKYKAGASSSGSSSTKKPTGDLPAALDKDMISAGVSKISGKAQSCGGQSSAKGVVKVGVKVGADGRVVSVTVKQTPDPALGNCVASAMQKATFAKTATGGSFSYPFSF